MSVVLVIAEHENSALSAATLACIGAAARFGATRVDVAVLDRDPSTVADQIARIAGVDRVLTVAGVHNTPYLAAIWAPQLAALAADHTHVLAPATTFGKDLLPRVAALLDVGMLSDITAIDGPYEARRPVYAGNAIVRVAADPAQKLCATIRTTAFDTSTDGGSAVIEPVSLTAPVPDHTRFIERRSGRDSGPDLQTAARVVGGGRGLGGESGFELARKLADSMGAALGASRAAVDSGWVSNDLQIGQTGKIVEPELYFALGISGAIQHLTGIRDAGTIVAINTDAAAPICNVADIVLIADLFSAIPELIEQLEARAAS